MRNFQKQQLLDIISSLHILHQEIKDRLVKREYPTVQNALSDAQEAAIQMGEAIEMLEGEGTEAVSYLEKYCEKLYHASIQMEESAPQKIYKTLESILIKAENAVNHIKVRKEVVFFPYKASMWDSLESVYIAAKEDKDCDAYVVPIPYYDKNPDGSLAAMYYEGNEYPKNIEITDYRTYDPEERRPDAIFIHNPYDDWNHVTSVPDRYFSKNLKNYTDCLVYIPYFILKDIEPDDAAAIEGMKHFCFVPGTIYADKVIVQSENMRRIYINEYLKEAKSLGLPADREDLENRILGIGSPKLDKVRNVSKEDLDIPGEWLKVIRKSDGTRKKIVFYNTSINALLRHDEEMLAKMESVFNVFKKYQDEIALLWRPHPLIPNTIKSMRPQLWIEYQKIVENYKKEGWGIYDDSADMDRAVLISDAYYGDGSSIVQVYAQTGKPILMQNVECVDDDKEDKNALEKKMILSRAFYYGCVIEDDTVYFSLANYNAVCRAKYMQNHLEILDVFPNVKADARRPYPGIYKHENRLIFFPTINEKNEIMVYNIADRTFTGIKNNKDLDCNNVARQIFEYDKNIYFISTLTGEINRINMDELSIDNVVPAVCSGKTVIVGEVTVYKDDMIFYPVNSKKILCSFSLHNEEFKYYEYPENVSYIATLCFNNDELWITGTDRKLYVWKAGAETADPCSEFPSDLQLFYNDDKNATPYFFSSFVYKDCLWLFPDYCDKILNYNLVSGQFSILEISGEEEKAGKEKGRFFMHKYAFVKKFDDKAYFLSAKTRILYELCLETNEISKHSFNSEGKYKDEIYPKSIEGAVMERYDIINLEEYLIYVLKKDRKICFEKKDIVGKKIYESIVI